MLHANICHPTDSRLSHRLSLADDFQLTPHDAVHRRQRGDYIVLSQFRDLEDSCRSVTVLAANSETEVGSAESLIMQLDREGYDVLDATSRYEPTGCQVEVKSHLTDERGETFAFHASAKDGQNLFWVEARTRTTSPQTAEVAWGEMAQICRSFKLISPTGERCAEPLASFAMVDPFELEFAHPATWAVDRSQIALTSAKINLFALQDEEIIGRIWLRAKIDERLDSGDEVFDLAAEDLREMAGDTSKAVRIAGQPSPQFDEALVLTMPVENRPDLVATSLVQSRHDRAVSLTMLCPTWSTSCEYWGRSKRTFEIVRDSLRVEKKQS
jgi:hypothetical protein